MRFFIGQIDGQYALNRNDELRKNRELRQQLINQERIITDLHGRIRDLETALAATKSTREEGTR